MNKYLTQIIPSTIIIVLFFLITIFAFKYLGISFKDDSDPVLKRIITVETFSDKKIINSGYSECIG